MNILKKAYTFDDLMLVPQKSSLKSRKDANTSTTVAPGIKLDIPIISSNMSTVTESQMMSYMAKFGGMGILHRYLSIEDQVSELVKASNLMDEYKTKNKYLCAAVGVTGDWFERAEQLIKNGMDIICFDIAHGYCDLMENALKKFKDNYPDFPIIAGNVSDLYSAMELFSWGVDTVKCGIGPGSNCTTRVMTGFGVPMLTSLDECVKATARGWSTPKYVIADGGIRSPGDAVKALAVGSNAVMLGSILAGTKATPGPKIFREDKILKKYSGMASEDAIASANIKKKEDIVPEGITRYVPYKGKVENVLNNIIGGIKSGISYGGATNLKELAENAEFVEQTQAGYLEGTAHGLKK